MLPCGVALKKPWTERATISGDELKAKRHKPGSSRTTGDKIMDLRNISETQSSGLDFE
jgi:hypothetical protein